jgi:hypothetical protein
MAGEPIRIARTTVSVSPANTAETSILSNANASGVRYEIVSLLAANNDTSGAHGASARRFDQAALAGTGTYLAKVIQVPAEATLILIDASTPVELPPNSSLAITTDSANNISFTLTYDTYLGA